ncbi:MAG: DUF2933 domain-containing protein [Rhizobiaceae bacterium]
MTKPAHHHPWWRSPFGIVLCAFLLIAGFYLLTEHRAHLLGILPYLLLLACPLMHLFMHHGHHGHDHSGGNKHRPGREDAE